MKIFKISDRMYDRGYSLIVNCSEQQLLDWQENKYGVKESLRDSNGRYFTLEKGSKILRFIWIEKFDWTVCQLSLLAHEVLHLTIANLKEVGIELHGKSEEAFTWYMQHLIQGAYLALRKIHKNYKKKNVNRRNKNTRDRSSTRHKGSQ